MKEKFHCYCCDCRNSLQLFTSCDFLSWCEKYHNVVETNEKKFICLGFIQK